MILILLLILAIIIIIIIIIIIANITMKQLKWGDVIIFREPNGTFVSTDLKVIQVPIQCPPSRPKPTFRPKWEISVNVGLGREDYLDSFQ